MMKLNRLSPLTRHTGRGCFYWKISQSLTPNQRFVHLPQHIPFMNREQKAKHAIDESVSSSFSGAEIHENFRTMRLAKSIPPVSYIEASDHATVKYDEDYDQQELHMSPTHVWNSVYEPPTHDSDKVFPYEDVDCIRKGSYECDICNDTMPPMYQNYIYQSTTFSSNCMPDFIDESDESY
jgi:hypothetical protein